MITKVVMPQLSLSMRTGIINRWYKHEGDFVRKGDVLCEIEADKASTDFESPVDGYIKKLVAQEGEEFPVREVMLLIGDQADLLTEDSHPQSHTLQVTEAAPVEKQKEVVAPANRKIMATPVAKRLAQELGIDLAQLKGTGPDGMVSKDDVLAAKEALAGTTDRPKNTDKADDTYEAKGIKKIVSDRMRESYQTIPHIHLTLSCNMSRIVEKRVQYNQNSVDRVHLTFTDILVWAVSRTLGKHILLNASFHDGQITTYGSVNVSIAVASEKGLIVPVIKKADQMSLPEIASCRHELVEKVNSGKQTLDDLNGGTFTITNLGMYDIEQFDAIINPGQSAILSAGKIKPTPIADEDGGIAVKPIVTLTLACDHRVADGVDAARFLADLKNLLEDPGEMFAGIV
jgi:pyruvate dehydrogenase E2 component (dihydrolipoamide acetyltransferase)